MDGLTMKGNPYRAARMKAADRNFILNSRERAAELLFIGERSLADYELGARRPSPDVVMRMADAYEAPELLDHYCRCECPAGYDHMAMLPVLLKAVEELGKIKEVISSLEQMADKLAQAERGRA